VSWPKTKLQNLGTGNQLVPTIPMFNRNAIKPAGDFVYVGSIQSSHGYCQSDRL